MICSSLLTCVLLAAAAPIPAEDSLQALVLEDVGAGGLAFSVRLDGHDREVRLERHSLRAPDMALLVAVAGQDVQRVPLPAPRTWRGFLSDSPLSIVAASIGEDGVHAVISDPITGSDWQVEPAPDAGAGVHRILRDDEIASEGLRCGVTQSVTPVPAAASGDLATGGVPMQLAEIAIDSDHEYFLQNGSSVAATVARIERVMNRVDAIFERDTQVRFQITAIVVRTGPSDPYSGLDLLDRLNQFRSHWIPNFAAVRRDVAHLFTGVAHDDWAIGYAWLAVVCNSQWGYGISERYQGLLRSSALTAHEIGHNFSANHCDGNGDCQVMCSMISGCNGGLNLFGQASADVIRDYAQARPCLLDVAPPLSLPVHDSVTSTQLDRSLWASPQGVTISELGVNEPSAPYSLELDAAGSGPFDGDQLITNQMLLAQEVSVTLRMATQHRGVPAGVELEVAVWGDDRVWLELGTIVSDGVDQASYTPHEFPLPPVAFHDEAKVRIRVLGGAPGQTWFIDDFALERECDGPQVYCAAMPNSVSPDGASLEVVGSTSIALNDLGLLAYGCPPASTGIFLLGDSQQSLPVGNGMLCVAGSPLYRLAVSQANPLGLNSLSIDLLSLPTGTQPAVGDRWNVQLWYRDSVGALSNLTEAIELTLCP